MSDRIRADAEAPDEPRREPVPEPQEGPGEEPRPQQREEPSAPPAAPDEAAEPSGAQGEPSVEEQRLAQQMRIDRLTREKFEAQRQRDQVLAEFERVRREASQGQRPWPGDKEDPYDRARREVRDEQIANEFNRQCNTLYQKGQQEYGAEMDDAVGALNAVGWGNRPEALAAIIQLPDGHRVYRELAKNLDNAARILNLPPIPMVMELARLSHGEAAANGAGNGASVPGEAGMHGSAVPVSRAPEPHRPVGGTSRAAELPLDDRRVSMAEYIRRRDRNDRRSRISR